MGVSGVKANQAQTSAVAGQRCHCVDDLLAPLRSKMKVLKKFKKRIGLAPRSSGGSGGTNNLPPLLFHQVHGDNVRISRDGAVARRAESFCKGIAFSARPVKVAEKVCVKFLDVSNNWSGVIRFGFTANDPSTLRYGLPKYACPDLTNKPGYWAKALAERFAERDTVLFFYVTQAGDVHFGINGEEKGVFFSGVETRSPLWAIVDLYGNSTAIEFVDPRHQLNNSRRNLSASSGGNGESPDAVERLILPLTALSVSQQNQQQPRCVAEEEAAPARCQQPPPPPPPTTTTYYNPLPFHRTRGRNVRMSNDRCVASRADTEFCHGYVFTSRPLQLGERLVIQVLATEPMYVGSLAFGLTSCDPASLQAADLPDDSDQLLDRHEYWVVSKDVAGGPQRGDELAFSVLPTGEVTCSKNGAPPFTLMHVDQSLQLWAFVDVYGTTQKIRVLGSTAAPRPRNSTPPLRVAMPLGAMSPTSPPRFCGPEVAHASAELVQFQPAMGGGTVLVVNLPPAHSNYLNQQNQQNQHLPAMLAQEAQQPATSGTLLSTYSHTYIEPVSGTYSTLDSTTSLQQWAEATAAGGGTGGGSGAECTICYERPIDSVLYMCGHMCMCFECAVQQWRGKGGGHCPLCRAVIRDVIRTYKS